MTNIATPYKNRTEIFKMVVDVVSECCCVMFLKHCATTYGQTLAIIYLFYDDVTVYCMAMSNIFKNKTNILMKKEGQFSILPHVSTTG